jgi:hypothetical protein
MHVLACPRFFFWLFFFLLFFSGFFLLFSFLAAGAVRQGVLIDLNVDARRRCAWRCRVPPRAGGARVH